jgi:aspartyl-tRNA(Asn)/glutamyl-tRNA(Gln) amidotransferase subunit B
LAALITKLNSGELPGSRSREIFDRMATLQETVVESIAALGITRLDRSDVEQLCKELLAENPHIVDDLRSGITKAVGALIGQAKKRNPNVDPTLVRETCLRLASEQNPAQ